MFTKHMGDAIRIRIIHLATIITYHLSDTHAKIHIVQYKIRRHCVTECDLVVLLIINFGNVHKLNVYQQ